MPFTEEHEALRRTVRAFVEREIAPHVDRWEREAAFPRELYEKAGDVGILGAGYPEEVGGAGGDILHQVVVMEELVRSGSAGLAASLLAHGIALTPILLAGTDEQKRRFVEPVLSGSRIAALAVTEPGAGSDVAGAATRAVREEGGYRVTGRKVFITNGVRADFVTALVRTGEPGAHGLSLVVIDREREGYQVTRALEKLGWHPSDTAELAFDGVLVPEDQRIGPENGGFPLLMANFAQERLFLAVAAVAIGQLAYEEALRFAREREVFGRKLLGHQVTRHKLAEMQASLEVARTYVYHVAERVRAGDPAIREAAIAKNASTDAAARVVDEALQIHGGYGYMREYLVERLYRDIRLYPIGGGTREIMNEVIAKSL